jgi:hypothetical protein
MTANKNSRAYKDIRTRASPGGMESSSTGTHTHTSASCKPKQRRQNPKKNTDHKNQVQSSTPLTTVNKCDPFKLGQLALAVDQDICPVTSLRQELASSTLDPSTHAVQSMPGQARAPWSPVQVWAPLAQFMHMPALEAPSSE